MTLDALRRRSKNCLRALRQERHFASTATSTAIDAIQREAVQVDIASASGCAFMTLKERLGGLAAGAEGNLNG